MTEFHGLRRRGPSSRLALSLLALAACGGQPALEFPERTPTALDSASSGAVVGSVSFAGTPPAREEIALGSVGACAAVHATPPLTETVVVHDGQLANAIVYVKSGLEGRVFAIPREPVTVDQKGCVFLPHVRSVQTYTPVRFVNSDPLLHNVRSASERNRPFNLALSQSGSERLVQFESAEMVPITCDVHGWMRAYVGVFDHPYHAVTGGDGRFALRALPAGHYVLEAWHETLGTKTAEVDVPAGGEASATFSF